MNKEKIPVAVLVLLVCFGVAVVVLDAGLFMASPRPKETSTTINVMLSGICAGTRLMTVGVYDGSFGPVKIWTMREDELTCVVQDDMRNITQILGITLPRGSGPQHDGQWPAVFGPEEASPPVVTWSASDSGFSAQWPANTLAQGTVVRLLAPLGVTELKQ